MGHSSLTDRVRSTQRLLRKNMLKSVLDQFDGQLMKLDEDKRRAKYSKMTASPFLFYRGTAYLFYFDTSREWLPYHSAPERPTWIQGDLHFENFGAFRSESGRIVFDVNDFDEGYLGSYLYDVLRMAVSVSLISRMMGLETEAEGEAIKQYAEAYYRQIQRFAKRKEDPCDLVFDEEHTDGPIRKLLRKVQKRSTSDFLEEVTTLLPENRRFIRSAEIVAVTEEERARLLAAWPDYIGTIEPKTKRPDAHYGIKDLAVKHGSGTASIGLDRYYVLIEAEGGNQALDDVVLEVKEVRVPVPAYFMPYSETFWNYFGHQGKRVIVTQQAMHHEADPYLGYLTIEDRHFYVRERSPYKKKLKVDKLDGAEELLAALETMGQITAKMHARADVDVKEGLLDYHSEDEIYAAMGEDRGAFAEFVANWAMSYAYQVEEDYVLFKEWVEERSA
ncbi:DUF2252 domain-containing protein [Paenibacillus chartarius]|uniref:DUF2252 domain-containing protein n=1 Tax=Paenibacillus chartarius TaxID=747481 RepID=A0ABV6DE73_9BACL